MPNTLEIFVHHDCENCETAHQLAREVRLRLPHIVVHLRETNQLDKLPDSVFAVPTYLFNGKRISLGNPSLSDLLHRLNT